MNFKDPVIRRGTLKMCLCDVVHNIYFILQIYLGYYTVTFILSAKAQGKQELMLIPYEPVLNLVAVCGATIVPHFLLWLLDLRRCYWKVGGASRKKVQANLLRKFLN